MWVAQSTFDGSGTLRRKLLKPGKAYRVGRKAPVELLIDSKTVSQECATLDVGTQLQPGNVGDFDIRPSLGFTNHHAKKPFVVLVKQPEGDAVQEAVQPGASCELHDGDEIRITQTISILVSWWPSQFVAGGKNDAEAVQARAAQCAELGKSPTAVSRPADYHTTR